MKSNTDELNAEQRKKEVLKIWETVVGKSECIDVPIGDLVVFL